MPKAHKQSEQPNSRVILFLGAPGSGKGTQSSWLASHLGIPAISTGDMLRSEAKHNTRAGARLREILASGSLVSDEVVCEAVASRLKGDLPSRGIILDGFPRTLKQAVCLDQIAREPRNAAARGRESARFRGAAPRKADGPAAMRQMRRYL